MTCFLTALATVVIGVPAMMWVLGVAIMNWGWRSNTKDQRRAERKWARWWNKERDWW